MSSIEPAAQVDFVYDASFYFEDLPSRSNDQGSDEPHLQPAWYLTARAPVPFSEDVFWNVLERWILEAPSIIPPIAKVEILHDYTQQDDDDHGSVASSHTSSDLAQLLVETSTDNSKDNSNSNPFRTIRRRLLPKRANKDPVMEEQLFFVRSSQGSSSNGSSSRSHAVHAPIVRSSTSPSPSSSHSDRTESNEGNQSQEHDQSRDFMTQAKSLLPFYYPKVRGFRYGYVADPEEAPEDRDDHDHDHDGEGEGDGCFEYKDEEEKEVENEKQDGTKAAGKVKTMSKRLGWITLELFLAGDEGEFTEKMQYAFKELFKKLYKWGVNTTKGFTKSRVQHDIMVPKELYLATYARLKETHAQRWVQSWPEKTDPTKFVFEDIAIASWLVALWELERTGQRSDLDNDDNKNTVEQGQVQEDDINGCKKRKRESQKQTFVDLGCGNGLLTHILNQEGHKGIGIDIVARKVWDIYGPGTSLEAKTVIPNETVFNNVDWIIGNHADELAPWIPIIAARSKPLTRFAVIPCCFFDLNGSRHQFPKGAPEGKYKAYQEYISGIITDTCGYDLQTEILRIPSTKNVALVGMIRKRKRGGDSSSSSSINDDGTDGEDGVEDRSMEKRIHALVQKSGVFVARVSDKDKQALQKSKQAAKLLAREADSPLVV